MSELFNLLGPAPAYAQGAPGGGAGSFLTSFFPFILIFVLFYFLLIRPQQKRQKEHRLMLESLKKGDKVVTSGGILGTVAAVGKDIVTLQVSDSTRIRLMRNDILAIQDSALDSGDDK